MSEAALRPATPAHADAVARIWREGWRDGHLGHVPAALVEVRTPESFSQRAADGVADTTVAVVDGEVAGRRQPIRAAHGALPPVHRPHSAFVALPLGDLRGHSVRAEASLHARDELRSQPGNRRHQPHGQRCDIDLAAVLLDCGDDCVGDLVG